MNKQNFLIFLLIFLAGFLFVPNISLSFDDDINLREMGKYLELPSGQVEKLLRSLINLFYSQWIDQMASGYSTDQERAVPSIMKKAVQVQALNHLLIDAPIQTTWLIVKNATTIARVFLTQDPSALLRELEKQSVKKAVNYGMSVLLEQEIRITPGAIDFEYTSQKGEKKIASFQFIMVYKPMDSKKGDLLIRFFSPNPIESPKNEMSYGGAWGIYTDLKHDLSPFIVDIQGAVEDYKWAGAPSMKIEFPSEVPDLGIRPLSFWERFALKPIESFIKDIEIIITKITGQSLGLVEAWNKIKSFISGIISFLPAAIVSPSAPESDSIPAKKPTIPDSLLEQTPGSDPVPDQAPALLEPAPLPVYEQGTFLEDLQKMLDDLAWQINILAQKLAQLAEAESRQSGEAFYGQGGVLHLQPKTGQDQEQSQEEAGEEKEDEGEREEEKEGEEGPDPGLDPLLTVVINEIAWAGTRANSDHQWIELYNSTDSDIDLTGWKIFKNEEEFIVISTSTAATTTILAESFYLLETSEEATDISADLIYGGVFKISGANLELRDSEGNLIDKVGCLENEGNECVSWFAGDNDAKQTMERLKPELAGTDPDNWASNNLITRNGLDAGSPPNKINGTPRQKNSVSKSDTEITQQNLDQLFEEFDKITLSYYGSPYITSGLKVPENKILSIDSGVVLRFRPAFRKYELGALIVEGTLLADGSQGEIVFTSIYDQDYGGEGFGSRPWERRWRGIRFHPASQNSELENVLIKYAGGSFDHEASRGVAVEITSIKLKNSVIENSNTGLYLKNSDSQIENLTIKDSGPSYGAIGISGGGPVIKNSFFKNGSSGMVIRDGSRAEIIGNHFEEIQYGQGAILVENSASIFKDNSGKNNALNGIYLLGKVENDWHLFQNDEYFPYVVGNLEISVNTTLTIEAGAIIKFAKSGKINMNGTLKAIGEETKKIIFTSIADDEYGGDTDGISADPYSYLWDRIHFFSLSHNSVVQHTVFRYGGKPFTSGFPYSIGVIYLEDSSTTEISDSYFENMERGIQIEGDCPRIERVNFSNVGCPFHRGGSCYNTFGEFCLVL